MKESYLFLAHGFEEIEALTVVDVLRRAGLAVKTVSITNSLQVEGAHGITVNADLLFADTNFDNSDWLICPGGMPGATNLHEFVPLQELLTEHNNHKGNIAAICAAPAVVLYPLGILDGKKATCYPGFDKECVKANMTALPVAVDKNVVTGNGPASAMFWALTIVEHARGLNCARDVAAGLLYFPPKENDLDFTFG